ncbi:MAG: phosphoribosylamine--glycine ligase [Candidatus Dormibacteraeota bacterium]|nr:phosphoribosylamine--glycine ligase [Candidatus Dormibacteraeota bacterium]
MKVLVVGSGAREHALAWKCMLSDRVERVYVAPGNGGTAAIARNVAVQADDVVRLVKLARKARVGLAVLGPEAAVAAGVGDALQHAGIPVFGPTRSAGHIETSKSFAKEVMHAAGIPTAESAGFNEAEPARAWAAARGGRVAVKADGLALGKGVVVCDSVEESDRAVDSMLVRHSFGRAGATVIVEERLEGPELSLFGIIEGTTVVALAPARDFKRAREGDQGPNTGGMGAYSPPLGVEAGLVADLTAAVLAPAAAELARRGTPYVGALYAGLMLTPDGPRVLEFNARFGDPEAQAILPRLRSDLPELMLAAATGQLATHPSLEWDPRPAVAVVVASGGYPEAYETGFEIAGLADVPPGVLMFHAGTRTSANGVTTAGGRVLTSVGLGEDVAEARQRALAGAVRVRFPGAVFRKDIAQEAI